jgi:hypothetical protein
MNKLINTQVDVHTLVQNLKAKENKLRQFLQGTTGAVLIIGMFYLVFVAINPDNFLSPNDRIGGLFLASGLILSAIYYIYLQQRIKSFTYDAPTLILLKQIVNRLNYLDKWSWLSLIPFLLIDAGFTIGTLREYWGLTTLHWILLSQTIWLIIGLISMYSGYLIWRKTSKPMRDQALAHIAELEA